MIGERTVERSNNKIIIKRMDASRVPSDFIRAMYNGTSRGYSSFDIEIENPESPVFPNSCTPISAMIEYYKHNGIDFSFSNIVDNYLFKCKFKSPQELSANEIEMLLSPFDLIIKYSNSSQVAAYTQKCVDYISHQTECEEGILSSLIWCINEVMDNVLLHSESGYGYVLAQYHITTKHIAICVCDTGIGIYNSMKNSKHRPAKAVDAISLAIQEGVGDGQGQGNGLYGLYEIVTRNQGRLSITSGPASILWDADHNLTKYDNIPYLNRANQCTTVDFQLDLNKKVDINDAFSSIGGFDGFDIRIDDMLTDDGLIHYDVYANCEGTATRDAGKLIRNDVINTIRRTNNRIQIDFANVKTASSSFLDEFIAKLFLGLGAIQFNQIVTISNMNTTIRHLTERSIYMRISDEWNKEIVSIE